MFLSNIFERRNHLVIPVCGNFCSHDFCSHDDKLFWRKYFFSCLRNRYVTSLACASSFRTWSIHVEVYTKEPFSDSRLDSPEKLPPPIEIKTKKKSKRCAWQRDADADIIPRQVNNFMVNVAHKLSDPRASSSLICIASCLALGLRQKNCNRLRAQWPFVLLFFSRNSNLLNDKKLSRTGRNHLDVLSSEPI